MSEFRSKIVTKSVGLTLALLRRAGFLRGVDLPGILEDHAQQLLDLPGQLPFLPFRLGNLAEVRKFLPSMHPVHGGRPLIRLGPAGDGGYLVSDDLEGIAACFSPGVSTVSGFELDCAQRGMRVLMADGSVEGPATAHPRFEFMRKYIGGRTGEGFISLEDWVAGAGVAQEAELLLQMDIEGWEYEALLAAPSALLRRFRIMVIEFHGLEALLSERVFPLYRCVFEKILQTHACVHIHPNNWATILNACGLEMLQLAEFTFLRRDRVRDHSPCAVFPHPLDRDNTGKSPVVLPRSFYRSTQGCAGIPPASHETP